MKTEYNLGINPTAFVPCLQTSKVDAEVSG